MEKVNLAYPVYFQMQYSVITSEKLHYTKRTKNTKSLIKKTFQCFLSLD